MKEKDGRFEVQDSDWNRLLLTGDPSRELPWKNGEIEKKYDSEADGIGTDLVLYDISGASSHRFHYTFFFHESGYAFKFGKEAMNNLQDIGETLENSESMSKAFGYSGSMSRLLDRIDSLEYSKSGYFADFEYISDNIL